LASEELKKLLVNAVGELDEALKDLESKDNKALALSVWGAASDVEYATFLMSLIRKESDDEWKRGWKLSSDIDVGETLVEAKKLLSEAIKDLNSRSEDAYEKAWLARGHILNVQDRLDKATQRRTFPRSPS
jgi:hypothetical protein